MYISVIQCGLPALPNLFYNQTEALPGSVTMVTCEEGFILKGSDILTCNDAGELDNALPACQCE